MLISKKTFLLASLIHILLPFSSVFAATFSSVLEKKENNREKLNQDYSSIDMNIYGTGFLVSGALYLYSQDVGSGRLSLDTGLNNLKRNITRINFDNKEIQALFGLSAAAIGVYILWGDLFGEDANAYIAPDIIDQTITLTILLN